MARDRNKGEPQPTETGLEGSKEARCGVEIRNGSRFSAGGRAEPCAQTEEDHWEEVRVWGRSLQRPKSQLIRQTEYATVDLHV